MRTLVIRDFIGNEWRSRHIYRGTPRWHPLTTGWSEFVNATGDSVVFSKKAPTELFDPAAVSHGERKGEAAREGFMRSGMGRAAAAEAVRESESGEKGL